MTLLRAAIAVLAALLLAPGAVSAAVSLVEVPEFGSNPGRLQMFTYVPDHLPAQAPLVVVAHGCLQTAADVAEHSGWVELATAHRFALIFPQTSRANESWGGCFRTWQPDHQHRGAGEPLSIVQMIDWMKTRQHVDAKRVFMTGMSSGGLLTNVMLATYPDVFAAGAPQSAGPYRCAESFDDVAGCAAGTKRLAAGVLGDLARNGYPGYSGRRPRVSLWHGSADRFLVVTNLTDELHQWADVLGIDEVPDGIEFVDGHARYRYQSASGAPLIETWMVSGLGHAMAVDPDSAHRPCGSTSAYFADSGLCAAYRIADWFGIATAH